MIKFRADPVSVIYSTDSHQDLESAHRLIALIPANIDFGAATQRIWGLAHTTGMQIQLLGLPNDMTGESRLRRELVTMASLLQDGKRCAEAKIETGTNWVESLKTNCQTGDMIVCFADPQTGILHKPLSRILESNLKATVYVLSELSPQKSKANRLAQIGTWLGVIVVIGGFGILQAKIVQLPAGWLQNVLLLLSLIPEFGLIWVWDSWFR